MHLITAGSATVMMEEAYEGKYYCKCHVILAAADIFFFLHNTAGCIFGQSLNLTNNHAFTTLAYSQ